MKVELFLNEAKDQDIIEYLEDVGDINDFFKDFVRLLSKNKKDRETIWKK